MHYQDSSEQAANYLRAAVPLMVRYKIPPNPLNYALWYTYVSNRVPALNSALDQTVQSFGTCTPLQSSQLYGTHLATSEHSEQQRIEADVIRVLDQLSQQSNNASAAAEKFSSNVQQHLCAIEGIRESRTAQSLISLDQLIQLLAEDAGLMQQSARNFEAQIAQAQQEIDVLRSELEQTRSRAMIDPLSEIFNRGVFDLELQHLIDRDQDLALLMLDVDHFKRFNDTYGHQMGDRVIQAMGQLLQSLTEEPAIAARYGGEEFAVILPGYCQTKAQQLAGKIRDAVSRVTLKQKTSGQPIDRITASIGLAVRAQGESADSLISRCDLALYSAKQQGRNRVVVSELTASAS